MKKILILVATLFLAVNVSAGEFLFSPTIGYSDTFVAGTLRGQLGHNSFYDSFACGFSIGVIAKNGFTFYWDNIFGINPYVRSQARTDLGETRKLRAPSIGCIWRTEFLFGGTLKIMEDQLHIGIAMGFGAGFGGGIFTKARVNNGKDIIPEKNDMGDYMTWSAGPSMHVNVDYYFNDWIGITASITNAVNIGGSYEVFTPSKHPESEYDGMASLFSNNFSLQVGPKFKF